MENYVKMDKRGYNESQVIALLCMSITGRLYEKGKALGNIMNFQGFQLTRMKTLVFEVGFLELSK